MNKKYYVTVVFFIAISVIVAVTVRLSFIDFKSLERMNKDNFKILRGGNILTIEKNNDIIENDNLSFSDLLNDAEVVVKGITLNERIYLHGATLTAFKVNKVYKGNISSKKIYLFEPSYFDFKYSTFFIYNGYNLMRAGKEYILFLKNWQYKKCVQYHPFYKTKNVYILAHNSGIDKYSVNKSFEVKIVEDDVVYYKQIKNLDFCACTNKEAEKYNELKKEVIVKLYNTRFN